MKIRTFGKITEIVNKEIDINFPLNFAELKAKLEFEFPLLKTLVYSIAIDEVLISDDKKIISKATTIAIMPPFSGG